MAENRRTRITKHLLMESFLELLEIKPLQKITVKEICERADVNRSTYYAYYKDPYDQLERIESKIMADMPVYIEEAKEDNAGQGLPTAPILTAQLEYINERKALFRVLMGEHGDWSFELRLLRFFADKLFGQAKPEGDAARRNVYRYIFVATGMCGVIRKWVMDDDPVDAQTLASWIFEASIREGLSVS